MTVIDSLILGLIQGLTEFLPVSSSGHLVIGEALLGFSSPGVSLEIWLHFGTLLAVFIYFRRRFVQILSGSLSGAERGETVRSRTMLGAIIIGTVPAIIAGLLFKSVIENIFDSPRFAAAMLIATGILLLSTILARNRRRAVNLPRGFLIGVAQMIAILPGVSRSGSTIAGAMFMGVDPGEAAEFSFLLAAPIIALAFGYDVVFSEAALFTSDAMWMYMIGAAVAFVVGLLAIHYLLKIVRTGRFYLFGFYCLVAGAISFILLP